MADGMVSEQVFKLTIDNLQKDVDESRRIADDAQAKANKIDQVVEMFKGLARSVDSLRDDQKWMLRFLIAQLAGLVIMFAKSFMG